MKAAINAWSLRGEADFEECFASAKEAGFDGIELNIDRSGAHSLTLETTDAELAGIAKLSEKYALPVVSISTSLWGGNMGLGTDGSRAFSAKLLEAQLRFAKALGAKSVLTVPGGMTDEISMTAAFRNSRQVLISLIPLIERYGIEVGVENVWNGFFTSPFDMLRFVESIDCRLVKAYYDIGNTLAFSRTEDWIEILGGTITAMHIKGYRRNSGINGGGVWCNITDSDYDWSRVRAAIEQIGYDGCITAEVGKYDSTQTYPDYYRMVCGEIRSLFG